jgi:hypothetical protein
MPEQDVPSIANLFAQAHMDNPLPKKILNAISQGDSLQEITVAKCTEQECQV